MAKKSVQNRNEKRNKLSERFREKRDALREACRNIHLSPEERHEAARKLQDLPRDSSRSRVRNRCHESTCNRPRAFNKLTGLCRLHMRRVVINGLVPGMQKASW